MKHYKVQVVVVEPGQGYGPGKIIAARTVTSIQGDKKTSLLVMNACAKIAKGTLFHRLLKTTQTE